MEYRGKNIMDPKKIKIFIMSMAGWIFFRGFGLLDLQSLMEGINKETFLI